MPDRPLRCHFVWTGARFPYHARLAVESALVSMPDAFASIHVVGPLPDGPHLRSVAGHDRVRVVRTRLDECFESCPFGAAPYLALASRLVTPASISNLVRLAVLHRDGGVYLDTDVLVLRGLHDPERHGAYVGREWVWSTNRARIEGTWTWRDRIAAVPWAIRRSLVHVDARAAGGRLRAADRVDPERYHRLQVNNAVIGAPPRAAFVEAALAAALDVDPTRRFALGPTLLDDVARALPGTVHVVPPTRFYAVPPGDSVRYFRDRRLEHPIDAQVMHYVASNHRRLLSTLDVDDPRFARHPAPFWRRAAEVRASVGSGATGRRDVIDLRQAG
ncbi:MAG: glycosyltransferase [Acidimicrobiia bacterium]